MPFTSPSWVPLLPDIPENISLEKFMFDENYGRFPLEYSKPPFSCALTGRQFSAVEVKERVEYLSRALCKEFNFEPDQGSEWDKVIGVFSMNTIDYLTLAWAVHRIGGILTCINAAYNASELQYQINDSGAKALFTCLPVLDTAKAGTQKSKIPSERIFILPLPDIASPNQDTDTQGHKTIEDLIDTGKQLSKLPASDESWKKGEAKTRCAFLCYSSGTSGLPKGVMISHYNVIANIIQVNTYESNWRKEQQNTGEGLQYTENCLGLLPMSHIYGLLVVSHIGPYRGDGVVVLPKYDFKWFLQSIENYKLVTLYLVPPIIIQLMKAKEKDVVKQYDLSSVRSFFTAGAPLGEETARELAEQFPNIAVRQSYGLTETAVVVCSTMPHDVYFGSSGSLLPGITARIVPVEGDHEVTGHDQPGELWVKSPGVVLGYLNNRTANNETFIDEPDGRYMRTGDEVLIRKSKTGHEHIFITDRIKELIKVKGFPVAPAELEAHLLTHEAVDDCVVIGVPLEREGEVPKAFVVKNAGSKEEDDEKLQESIAQHVAAYKSDHKKLRGGVEFIDAVPKSPSGKILRKLLRDQEKAKAKGHGAKL